MNYFIRLFVVLYKSEIRAAKRSVQVLEFDKLIQMVSSICGQSVILIYLIRLSYPVDATIIENNCLKFLNLNFQLNQEMLFRLATIPIVRSFLF